MGKISFISLLMVFLFLWMGVCTASIAGTASHDLAGRIDGDSKLFKAYVINIEKTMKLIEEEKVLFSRERREDFNLQEKEKLYSLWGNFMDYLIAFDSLTESYKKFYLIKDKELHNRAFLLAYASYITKFANSLKFISKTIDNELYEKKLDDINSDYGISEGMYAKLKWNTIHVQDVTNILAGYQYYKFVTWNNKSTLDLKHNGWISEHIDSQYSYVKKELKLEGAKYFMANGIDILKDRSFSAWFPVQVKVSSWMGDTKVKRLDRYLINIGQIRKMDESLKPGDIIVERRNWYLSNVGLPGFWPHAELYIGTYDDMEDFFSDSSVLLYYRSIGDYRDFMDYLKKKYPHEMKVFVTRAHDGNPYQVIEAVSEGVKFSSLEESASADYIGVMRPRLSKLDIAKAVDEAFKYIDRPYDFNFDFLTDSALVCSELIYKAYLNGQDKKGLDFELRQIAGRSVVPPNSIVREFDMEFGTPGKKLDFIYFLDGSEREGRAFVRGESEFRDSHKRLKWDIAQE